ncbi:MAG: cytochrome c family protein [Deltaproteobacteria bacterium]|nr:cytochrome c family protein [Deltaproteobacteria bacterium]
MAVIFPRWTNRVPLLSALAVALGSVFAIGAMWYWFSPNYTDVGYQPAQPVEFSHKLHAGDLGMDCRYCHNTVEQGRFAAVPPTQTCMNCHKIVRADSPKLAAVRESAATGKPVEWTRVHMLPDYAYFDHSSHLAAGVGCQSCHGRIDQMAVVKQDQPLSMSWCLDCHRNPAPALRPFDKVTAMGYDPVAAGYQPDADPARGHKVMPPVNSCSGCHR